MAPTRSAVHSDIEYDFAKTQLAVFFVILLLAVDSINPVKLFLHVFPQVAPWHIATLATILMVYVFVSEMKQLLYFAVKVFFHSILSIFFREVSIVGAHNIPAYGPVIFTSNHANQFIDSVVMLSTCQRTVSYLIADKSWKRRVIGDIAWAMGAVPVKRAQDSAKVGKGSIQLSKKPQSSSVEAEKDDVLPVLYQITGTNTNFLSELSVGDKIRVEGVSSGLKVIDIESEVSMTVDGTGLTPDSDLSSSYPIFEIMKKMDQKAVYEAVLSKLASGGTIGIFPEGGSHDRTDLLPLKVGVALIAYSALEEELHVPVVPVGLNYFQGHRFRGRVIAEFGRPTYVNPKTLADYKKGGLHKRRVCTEFLEQIEDNMRSVIVSVPDYESLKLIHTARRLYTSKHTANSEKQDLSRRFAEGYKKILEQGNHPEEWLELQNRLKTYQKDLDELGIRDYQVPGLASEKNETDADSLLRRLRVPFRISELVLLSLLSLVPTLFLNMPVGLMAVLYANQRRKKAVAASKVKVKGMDVLLSEKVLLCIVMVPSLWMFYGLALYHFTNLDRHTIALVFISFPIFSYMGIVTAEAGMVELKDLKPALMRLLPSTKNRILALPAKRLQLQKDIREFVKSVGPSVLGDVYFEKTVDWAQFQQGTRRQSTPKPNSKSD